MANSTIRAVVRTQLRPAKSGKRKDKMNDKAETLRQAQTWQSNKKHYMELGLCSICSGQAAYGHQIGFRRVRPPCSSCLLTVLGFPVHEPGEWRSYSLRHGAELPARKPRQQPQEAIC